MRASELRDLTAEALENRTKELKEELMKMRFQKSSNQLLDKTKISLTKKEIARTLTVLNQKKREVSA